MVSGAVADPLTKFATPIGFASWGELSSPTRGEEGGAVVVYSLT